MRYADKKADFHKHARELECLLGKIKDLLSKGGVEARFKARDSLRFLRRETTNLQYCARISDLNFMVSRLQKFLHEIDSLDLSNEHSITLLAAKTHAPHFVSKIVAWADAICEDNQKIEFTHGRTVILSGQDKKVGVDFIRFENREHTDRSQVYSLWLKYDRSIASSFTTTPHLSLLWTPPVSTDQAALANIKYMAQMDRAFSQL